MYLQKDGALMAAGKKNFIADAIKKPGALRAELHIKKGKKIPVIKLKSASKKKGVEGKRARLSITLSKLRKKK
jgi:hypothetical protein